MLMCLNGSEFLPALDFYSLQWDRQAKGKKSWKIGKVHVHTAESGITEQGEQTSIVFQG